MALDPEQPQEAQDFDTTVELLYGGPADDFIARRDAAAKAARTVGDRDLADRIKQLRRPTAAAALINRLRRTPVSSRLDALLDLGVRLREAQAALDTTAMKSLAGERNSLIAELLTEIGEISEDPVSGTVREQLTDTFTAAVADAEAARAVQSGRLVNSLRYSGFGEVDLRDAVAAPAPSSTPSPATTDEAPSTTAVGATEDDTGQHAEENAERDRQAAERRVTEARAALSAARDSENAALQSVELAERALNAARQTAKRARARAERATSARSAAEEAVAAAEAATGS